MPVRYLLDTNTASYVIKGNVPHVRERLVKVPMADVGISVISEAELCFGVLGSHKEGLKLAVDEFLLRVEILPWDSSAAQHYAAVRKMMEDSGTPMGNMDMMIAAHAWSVGATLVTHDRVFQRVKQLKIEDWTKPDC